MSVSGGPLDDGAPGGERRLAAILFSDLAGYTALMERDEARAIRARERHRAVLVPLVERFGGRVVEASGDEALAIFPSARLAVDCALEAQSTVRDDPDLALRMGIHLGDIVERGGEVAGEDVNIAARIRPLVEPGEVCVSEPVWSAVRRRRDLSVRRLGRRPLKGVARPLELFALDAAGAAPAAARRRRLRRAAVALGIVLLGGGALWLARGHALRAWVVLRVWPLVATPVEQEIGFATTSDGVRIAYAATGSGRVLVSVIGWATHLERGIESPLYDLHGVIDYLSRRHRLVRYDGRGFGLSQRDVDDFSLDARVRDLAAVVDAVSAERVAILGTSAGGPAAVAYAARHPERVSHLILQSAMTGGRRNDSLGEDLTRRSLELWRNHWDDPSVRGMLADRMSARNEFERRIVAEFLRVSGEGRAVAGFFAATRELDLEPEARRVRAPTLVIHGRRDATVPLSSGVELAGWIPGARLEILDMGHYGDRSFEEMNAALALVTDFLSAPPSGGAAR